LYFSGVFKVTLANQIQSVAVAWQIYSSTRSPLALTRRDIADRYSLKKKMTRGDLSVEEPHVSD